MNFEAKLSMNTNMGKVKFALYQAIRDDNPHVMIIKPYKKDRRAIQNRLMWHWYKELEQQSDRHGMSKDDLVCYNKYHIGVPILARDPEFSEVWDSMRFLSYEQKLKAMKFIPVTSIMNIKQMTEYLTDFKIYWNQKGCELTTSQDLYFAEALGIKK